MYFGAFKVHAVTKTGLFDLCIMTLTVMEKGFKKFLRAEIFAGRNFRQTNFRGINFRDFSHKLRKYVPQNLQNIEQTRKFVPQDLMIFQLKKTNFIKPSINKKNE